MENAQLVNVAEVQLSFKSKVKPQDRLKVNSSREAYEILRGTWNDDNIELYETFKLLLLNRANKVLGVLTVSQGGVSGTIADPKIIFAAALKCAASGIIVAHNHPSGNLNPSQADIDLTKKLKECGKFLEIQLLDHLICTTERYYSFADEGLV
jgi:DNA repair protein RadC